jgi:hypothetical protein
LACLDAWAVPACGQLVLLLLRISFLDRLHRAHAGSLTRACASSIARWRAAPARFLEGVEELLEERALLEARQRVRLHELQGQNRQRRRTAPCRTGGRRGTLKISSIAGLNRTGVICAAPALEQGYTTCARPRLTLSSSTSAMTLSRTLCRRFT